jgi:hypothetical protein
MNSDISTIISCKVSREVNIPQLEISINLTHLEKHIDLVVLIT